MIKLISAFFLGVMRYYIFLKFFRDFIISYSVILEKLKIYIKVNSDLIKTMVLDMSFIARNHVFFMSATIF